METLEETFARLQAAYETYDHSNGAGICALNLRLREQLKQYAASEQLSVNQDSAGSIGITKPGRDPTLAAIALSFPLDGCGKSWFISAFHVFNLLRADDLQCDVTLLGWSSMGERLIGRDIWIASDAKKGSALPILSQLERFSDLAHPSTITFSAIIEVREDAAVVTEVAGTPILVDTAKEHIGARGQLKATVLERRAIRAPELRVVGMEADVVTRELVKHYSEYLAALFENFD
ncbi:hypothetical protein FHL15_005382 [Xylaria flabelliformis]|uniref:Uncharacterized protein n=1 Tax=Xylaria flabelliformis TaxID=2512241 RepID=A0A553I0I2_9PEZI|nr:hypothetical protein FHL15_005382 [Xylaria flabelliformis]